MKSVKTEFSALGLLLVLWLVAAAGAYFVSHKPLTPGVAVSLLRAGGQLGAAVLILSLAGGLGRRVLPAGGGNPPVQAALGLGLLSLGVLGVGTFVGFSPLIGWGLALGLGMLLRREVLGWWRGLRGAFQPWGSGGLLGRVLGWGVLAVFGLALLSALPPPVRFDALVYHFALPKVYLAAGRVGYVEGSMFWGMPQAGEMLYLWAMSLAGAEAAAALGWCFGALAVAGLAGYAAGRLGARAGAAAGAALLAGATLADSLAWGYVDWLAGLFGLGVLVMLDARRGGQGEPAPAVGWAGLFAGFALGTKYTGGVALLAGLGVVLAASGNFRQRLKPALVFGGAAALASLPWWLRNFFATGNPFYPFLLPAGAMTPLRLALYQNQPAWGGWENALLLPWQAVVQGLEGAPGFGASLGAPLLAFGALAGLGWRGRAAHEQDAIRLAARFALAGLVVWAIAGRVSGLLIQSRLYFAIFPAFGLLAAAGFTALEKFHWPGVRLGRIAALLFALVFSLNLLQLARLTLERGAPQTLLALQSADGYLAANLGMTHLAMQALAALPPAARPLLLWEPRGYACLPACDPDEILDRWVSDARARQHYPAAILAAWQQAGYTHVLYYRAGADQFRADPRLTPADWRALDALLPRLTPVLDLNQIYTLYALP